MVGRYEEEDLSRVKPVSVDQRRSKISARDFVDPKSIPSGAPPTKWFPPVLAGKAIDSLARDLSAARAGGKEILWMVGAHLIKCGLSLYLRAFMEEGLISTLAVTGSAGIHDLELSFFGHTSEDVAEELPQGRFGMWAETSEHWAAAMEKACEERLGLGEALGAYLEQESPPHLSLSVLAAAFRLSIPTTVHVAFGTDIVHQHPGFPAAAAAEATMRDFRIFTRRVGRVFAGGVVILFGSAVVLPEVFLKAVSVNYNLGRRPAGVTVAAFDMIRHYRVEENVLRRPFPPECRRYAFVGHHEIMLPLLYQMTREEG